MFFGDNITIGDSLIITLFSMLLVFAVLIILSFTIDGFRLLSHRQGKNTENAGKPKDIIAEANKQAVSHVAENTPSQQDELELVAVITASIAAMLSKPASSIVVRNIVRVPQTTPVWSSASRQEMINK
ncbi:hypothetical protein DW1_2651 [Proteiniborus sp. DW1]|uniref:OadG family protein n=1 Tax=Proteiniborus sp. DW1 TaxID=1889883 RepID=UPI00092E0EAB|nr:OadG family protein [Proteiniborus sp. DW1]SCG84211.1 hypothetical protein DW1_2651 [Proteiniborus sp. DW1]